MTEKSDEEFVKDLIKDIKKNDPEGFVNSVNEHFEKMLNAAITGEWEDDA